MIIGITGHMGSGKTSVAQILSGIVITTILPFSSPVKDAALNLGWDGKKCVKGRRLLQLLGTECGRDCIDIDIWVNRWIDEFQNMTHDHIYVIADDIRFDNEADLLRSLGGIIICVKRPGYIGNGHASESSIGSINVDYEIDNSGDLRTLNNTVQRFNSKFLNR